MLFRLLTLALPLLINDVFGQVTANVSPSNNTITLTYSPETVQLNVTETVTISCTADNLTGYDTISSVRLIITDENGNKSVLAELEAPDEIEVSPKYNTTRNNISTQGCINQTMHKIVLNITWRNVTDDIFGYYRCQVTGFDNQQTAKNESSDVKQIEKHEMTPAEVAEVILRDRQRFEEELKTEMAQDKDGYKSLLDDFAKEINADISDLQESMNNLNSMMDEIRFQLAGASKRN